MPRCSPWTDADATGHGMRERPRRRGSHASVGDMPRDGRPIDHHRAGDGCRFGVWAICHAIGGCAICRGIGGRSNVAVWGWGRGCCMGDTLPDRRLIEHTEMRRVGPGTALVDYPPDGRKNAHTEARRLGAAVAVRPRRGKPDAVARAQPELVEAGEDVELARGHQDHLRARMAAARLMRLGPGRYTSSRNSTLSSVVGVSRSQRTPPSMSIDLASRLTR